MPAIPQEFNVHGRKIRVFTFQTLLVGSGAAALNCAEHLWDLGQRDLAVVTGKVGGGTSYNSGSDKQTYYKIGLFGDVPDSPMEFARTLTAGGMMHGDLAYIEGLGSAPEFFHLVKNGVPFPHNRYGAFVGYKTDHDPRQRATSAGPKTSRFMVEGSLARVRGNGTPVFDGHELVAILAAGQGGERRVIGILTLDRERLYEDGYGLTAFNAENVVLGTGGPGELYQISVYPAGQVGAHGLALSAGAVANNLTESQFGLASTKFRWNLSGTYQQVIPAYFSSDKPDGERRWFLNEYFPDAGSKADNVFLKGYQWPFHAARLQDLGSSIVDIAVHNEIAAGRRVFMDFTRNPVAGDGVGEFSFDCLGPEARRYLENSGATQATPYERLAHMNPESIDIYSEHNVDLKEPLDTAVCFQHNNGGLKGNIWWESNLRHLFPIGETNGAHGVRPGGSALNSGQVGGARAAQYIAYVHSGAPRPAADFVRQAGGQIESAYRKLDGFLNASGSAPAVRSVRREVQSRMSRAGAFIRSAAGVAAALKEGEQLRGRVAREGIRVASRAELPLAVQDEHLVLTHLAFLETMRVYLERGGGSRGAYMVLDDAGDRWVETKRGKELRHKGENLELRQEILETRVDEQGKIAVEAVPVRPLPDDQSWYETTWREYVNRTIYH